MKYFNKFANKLVIAMTILTMLTFGVLVAAAQESRIVTGTKLADEVSRTDFTDMYEFNTAGECASVVSIMSEDVKMGPSLTIKDDMGDPVATVSPKASGTTLRLPPGSETYTIVVNHAAGDPDQQVFWVMLNEDCSNVLTLPLSGSQTTSLAPNGGMQSMTVVVNDASSTLVIAPTNGGGTTVTTPDINTPNVPVTPVVPVTPDPNTGDDDTVGIDITIIIRDPLTDQLLNVFPVDLNAGIALNLQQGRYLIDIVGDVELAQVLDLTLSGDVSGDDLTFLDVKAGATVLDGKLLDIDASLNGDATDTDDSAALIEVDANALVGGQNGINVDAGASVAGTPLVDVNATVGGSNGINVNANVGGSTTPLVDVNANVGGQNGIVVDANVGGSATPLVDANAGVGQNGVDANVNVGGAPIIDVNVGGTQPQATAAPLIDVNTNNGGVNVNVGGAPIIGTGGLLGK